MATDMSVVQKYLSQNLWEQAKMFDIPNEFIQDNAKLIELVLTSRAIDTTEEKQNWFNLLPLMTSEQVSKLFEILEKERTKIQEIEQKYEAKKVEIKKKYLMKWQQMWYVQKVDEIKNKEADQRQKEDAAAEDLLNMI